MDKRIWSLWSNVPGYDDDESEEERRGRCQQAAGAAPLPAAKVAESLGEVLGVLGQDNWVQVPCMEFAPVRLRSAKCDARPRWSNLQGFTPCFRIAHVAAPIVEATLISNGLRPTVGPDWVILWSGPRMRESSYRGLGEFQRVNHFPGSTELTRKDRLWAHFHKMERIVGNDMFNFVPKTYVLPSQMNEFRDHFENKERDQIWIVKPNSASQGRGIFLLRGLEQVKMSEISVVSHYVSNPLLIQGLKFDLRIYVLVTSWDPLRAYVYREGLTRFASKPYSTLEEHLRDRFRHLTNYSINKKANNFIENQRLEADNYGHKWSLSALNRHLKCVGVDVKLMWGRIMDLLVKTLLSVEKVIACRTHQVLGRSANCFELYGFDVLVDEALKPWLLEVNLSPSMQAESPLDRQVKSSLLSDAFNLVGVRQVRPGMLTMSRLRTKLAQLQQRQPLAKDASAMASDLPPCDFEQEEQEEAAEPGDLAEEMEEVGEEVGEQGPVPLEALDRDDLRMLATSLEELQRRHNFIMLYPTESALEHYSWIMRLRGRARAFRANLLATTLFGKLPDFRVWEARMPVEATETPESPKTPPRPVDTSVSALAASLAGVHDPDRAVAAMDPLRVFGQKRSHQLVFMEYLVRLCTILARLSSAEKEVLEQSDAAEGLSAFRQALSLFVRTVLSPTLLPKPTALQGDGDTADKLCLVARAALVGVVNDACGGSAVSEQLSSFIRCAPRLTLGECLPAPFMQSASGCKAVSSLTGLSVHDLESILLSPQCTLELRSLMQAPLDDRKEPLRKRFLELRGVPCGPLGTLLLVFAPPGLEAETISPTPLVRSMLSPASRSTPALSTPHQGLPPLSSTLPPAGAHVLPAIGVQSPPPLRVQRSLPSLRARSLPPRAPELPGLGQIPTMVAQGLSTPVGRGMDLSPLRKSAYDMHRSLEDFGAAPGGRGPAGHAKAGLRPMDKVLMGSAVPDSDIEL